MLFSEKIGKLTHGAVSLIDCWLFKAQIFHIIEPQMISNSLIFNYFHCYNSNDVSFYGFMC